MQRFVFFSGVLLSAASLLAQAPARSLPRPIVGPSGGLSQGVSLPAYPKTPDALDKFTPVTDAALASPAPGDWLTWRRSHDDQGFSPLKQIDKSNVSSLRLAWSWALSNGPNESTPLVHDGVMFVHGFGDRVQAMDGATGNLLWDYKRELPKETPASVKRAIAIYGDRIYVATSDVHIVALDAKTGAVAWDTEVADYKAGLRMTGGPLVAKGKVMIGTGGRSPGGNYIVALDAATGKEAWRFNTIAKPGEPGGDSWNGLPLEKRNGASVWVPGSYDAKRNLAFFGPAQTYDTGPLLRPVNQPGITNDGLYTDSTVAINPDTGKLVWHFQHQPNDQWDLDYAFARVVVDLNINGQTKSAVVTGGKQAIFDVLEADSGKYLFSMDLGLQNSILSIDPVTGAKKVDQKTVPGSGETVTVCPHAGGAKNWIPESFNPETKMLFIPLVESCMDLSPVATGASLSSGVRWSVRPRLDSDGKYGRIEAINLQTRKVAWVQRQRAPQTSGVLATGGGLVFAGALDRFFRAYDAADGKMLWQARLSDVPSSAPISYTANGKQYIAVVVGAGGAQSNTYPLLVPEIQNSPERNSSLWVFEVPGAARTAAR
ncbi:MAG: PQQ-binding-like beta-propeller repeat protein [Bryobacteraceae bacterium]